MDARFRGNDGNISILMIKLHYKKLESRVKQAFYIAGARAAFEALLVCGKQVLKQVLDSDPPLWYDFSTNQE